jgi:hypothetical protein
MWGSRATADFTAYSFSTYLENEGGSGSLERPKNVSSIQNDVLLLFIQFVPGKIHHRYVAQMEL